MPDPDTPVLVELRRRLGLTDAVTIGAGSMIGAGVFTAWAPAAEAAGRAWRVHIEEPGQWLRTALEQEAAEVEEQKGRRKTRAGRRR